MHARSRAHTLGTALMLALPLVTLAGCDGKAAPVTRGATPATPATLNRVLDTARGGESIVLAPGQYGSLELSRREYRQPVSIDASRAVFTQMIFRNVDGLSFSGGAVEGPRAQTFAILVDSSRRISFKGMRISGSRIAISVVRSQDIGIESNRFDGTRSDGVNIAGSQRVRVIDNVCRNFNPILATYDGAGKLLHDGDHPDCIQGWSIVGRPPTADVIISGNQAEGFMQGVWFGNAGQGGYDRVVIRNNRMSLSAFNGIVIQEARDSDVSNNVVRTLPGARMQNAPFRPVTSWIKVTGARNRVCGNVVDKPRFSDDRGPC